MNKKNFEQENVVGANSTSEIVETSNSESLSNVDSIPGFIKEFSREVSEEERDALAGEIRERRRQRDGVRSEQGELSEEGERLTQELEALAGTIEQYNGASFLGKIKDYFEYKKTKAEIAEKTTALTGVKSSIVQKDEEIPEFKETKKMIDDFYEGESRKWVEAGYTPEDIAKQFTEEKLSKLSVDEYAELMKRFPGEMVTHTTRQGVRDHYQMWEHSAGLGQLHNSFKEILDSGRIKSSLGAALGQAETLKDICKFLNGGVEPTEDSVPKMVNQLKRLTEGSSNFNDKSSIHVAVEGVLDKIYGGETGNEVFFAYPSALVATQTKFSSSPFTPIEGPSSKHNDVYVWTDEDKGIAVDAGITFIPKNASVDPSTGSLYEIGQDGEPINVESEKDDSTVNRRYFKKPNITVDSETYWKDYFLNHPDKRPSKIVYYDTGDSPTQALWKWKAEHGIVKKDTAEALGFTENMQDPATRADGEDYLKKFNQVAVNALFSEYGATYVMGQYNRGWDSNRDLVEQMVEVQRKMYKLDRPDS